MSDRPDQSPDRATREGEDAEVRDAMATYATEGQGDDETGGDAAAGAAHDPGEPGAEDDREPHGPA